MKKQASRIYQHAFRALGCSIAMAGATAAAQVSLVLQAESFTNAGGAGFASLQDPFASAGAYATTLGNNTAGAPTDLASYQVNFPQAGLYTLYVRSLAEGGDNGTQDGNDSFFIPVELGASPTFGTRVNSISATTPDGQPEYHWINLSTRMGLDYGGTVDSPNTGQYNVTQAGVQTFVIGGRENGLRLDAFIFSTSSTLTAAALNQLAAAPAPQFPAPAAGTLIPGPSGGFGTFGIREVTNNGTVNTIAEAARSVQNNLSGNRAVIDYQASLINLYDSGDRGRFTGDSLYASDSDRSGAETDTVNNMSLLATGTIRITMGGIYTFNAVSDDGFRLTLFDQSGAVRPFTLAAGQAGTVINNGALEFPTGRGSNDNSFGQVDLPAGDYTLQLLTWEGTGGASTELSAAQGAFTTFDTGAFRLVGDTANGGIAVVPEPSSALLAAFGVTALALRRRRSR
jgi:MYXO-CTERM domain-containing protein